MGPNAKNLLSRGNGIRSNVVNFLDTSLDMEDVLIETGVSKNGNEAIVKKDAFDAALEIAEAFGSVPWKPKESPPPPATTKKKDQPESATSVSQKVAQPTNALNENSYKNPIGNDSEGAMIIDESSIFGRIFPSSKRNSQKASPFSRQQNNNCYQNSPNGYLSAEELQGPPKHSASFSFAVKNEMVSGFGCSNEAIARLPGRCHGRGRRGNGRSRRRGNISRLQNDIPISSGGGGKAGTANLNRTGTDGGQAGSNTSFGKGFSAFLQQPSNTTELNSLLQNEAVTVGGRRPSSFGHEGKDEIPSKKPCRLSCSFCGKTGHSSDDCFRNPKNQNNKDGMRCYNCNERGHMAARCTKPMMKTVRNRRISSNKQMRKERKNSNTENSRREAGATQAQNKAPQASQTNDLKGLEVICKLMKDKHLREEAAKKTPHLFDEMLTYMIEHISLNVTSK